MVVWIDRLQAVCIRLCEEVLSLLRDSQLIVVLGRPELGVVVACQIHVIQHEQVSVERAQAQVGFLLFRRALSGYAISHLGVDVVYPHDKVAVVAAGARGFKVYVRWRAVDHEAVLDDRHAVFVDLV